LVVTPPPPECANPECKALLRASDQLGEVVTPSSLGITPRQGPRHRVPLAHL
jgi:hypothetical protein